MQGLTRRQIDTFKFINEYYTKNGISPTYREITRGIGCKSISNTKRILDRLRERGYVDFLDQRARSIIILKEGLK